ncbi:biliverdin-producing heme oxygenase [Rhizobium sp. YJ-22]|uniref:biliverdin-producing heme oxygenase n=1 Tax=Rhizobium sp. YJ-22 TaxID=3037556 RepID=UPI002412E20A|nr:biliverdin-producing heme oxygenase [Rhizobium sp. YJ-22]MDG3578829.1 biliverdin-producing heme oxygenase [Rhizobium sp. YJ-22]
MQVSKRRFSLRERTSHLHAAVDAAVGSFETTQDYGRYLCGIHRFRADVEVGLTGMAWPSTFGGWRPQAVASLAAADLDDLHLNQRSGFSVVFDLADRSRLAGALYVLEGSSLGARVLYARAQGLGLSETFGARHLARQANGLENWRGFLAVLDGMADFDLDGAVDAAGDVFRHAAHAFEDGARHAA